MGIIIVREEQFKLTKYLSVSYSYSQVLLNLSTILVCIFTILPPFPKSNTI